MTTKPRTPVKRRHVSPRRYLTATHIRQLVFIVIVGLALYMFIPQLGSFQASLRLLSDANLSWLFVGLLCMLLTPIAAAAVYRLLVLRPIKYSLILLVQYAGMFVNRLLPAGIGGMSLFLDFFYKQKHSLAQASAVVVMNGVVGFFGHALSIIAVAFAVGLALPQIGLPSGALPYVVGGILLMLILAGIVFRNRLAARLKRFLHDLRIALASYRTRPQALLLATCSASIVTMLHVLALTCTLLAFGISMDLGAIIIILSGGIAAATASPTPGGIGGAEAGMTAILVLYGVTPSVALAVAVSYRLLSYWIPLVPGIVAFTIAQHRRLI